MNRKLSNFGIIVHHSGVWPSISVTVINIQIIHNFHGEKSTGEKEQEKSRSEFSPHLTFSEKASLIGHNYTTFQRLEGDL